MKISFLSEQARYSANFHDFYPLYKWRKQLLKSGFSIQIFYHHNAFFKADSDVFVFSNRYSFPKEISLIKNLNLLRSRNKKIVLLDLVDTSGCVNFNLINEIDLIIKKQLFRDRNNYTLKNDDLSVRPWLLRMPEPKVYPDYVQCSVEDLHKLVVGWNIGLNCYSDLEKPFAFAKNYFLDNLKKKSFNEIWSKKRLLTSVRGAVDYNNYEISYQRNKINHFINSVKNERLIVGSKVSKKLYLNEIRDSKFVMSPFGFGEICYRDFETMKYGCLLVKPYMGHLETFPDYFKDNDTYISLNWDLSNLENVFFDVVNNIEKYKIVAQSSFDRFYYYQESYEEFCKHFTDIFSKLYYRI